MMYGYENDWGAGSWVFMTLLMLVVAGAVIVSVLALVRSNRANTAAPYAGPGSARRILDERFARGEIDESEYATQRDLLSSL